MTTLVCKNPETGGEESLNHRVDKPQRSADWSAWNVLKSDESVEEVESGGQAGNVASNITQSSNARTLEAMLGNGISNVVDGVIWDLELVAKGIQ